MTRRPNHPRRRRTKWPRRSTPDTVNAPAQSEETGTFFKSHRLSPINMHTRSSMKTRKASGRLLSEVQLFRIRVATAESKVKVLREEARQAKRRRKAAKRLAQLARKQFKRSKADLAQLRQALAEAEMKLFKAGGRVLARKMAKPKPAPTPHRGERASKKPKAIIRPRGRRVAVFALPRASRRVSPKTPVTKRIDIVSQGQGDAGAFDQNQSNGPNHLAGANPQPAEQEIQERRQQEAQDQEI